MIGGRNPAWHAAEVELRTSAARFYPPAMKRSPQDDRLYEAHFARMFIEDLTHGLFPIHGRNRTKNEDAITLTIEGGWQPAKLRNLAADAFGFDDQQPYGARPFAEAFARWSRSCAQTIVAGGSALYELAYAYEADREQPIAFAVVPIRSGSVRRRLYLLGDYVQVVPEGARAHEYRLPEGRKILRAQHIELPQSSLVVTKLPKGLKYLATTVRRLKLLSDDRYPDFLMPTSGSPNPVPGDFGEFVRSSERAVAAATRLSGWNARNHFGKHQTEYYAVERFLRFERVKCQLREYLIDVGNDILRRVGPSLGFQVTVSTNGLPTLADVADAESLLREGHRTYKNLMSPFRLN